MFDKIKKITVITLFFAIIAASGLLSDFEGGKISETQNRILASFPDVENEEMTFATFTDQFQKWASDNIGFNELYNNLFTRLNMTLKTPATDRVHFGRDGFYFYTAMNAVKIATGEHIISDAKLRQIAENQQKISDYYKKKGKEYYVVLIPGKASVYPEKIRGGIFGQSETTVDRIEKYLLENTDVNVINVKNALLECKEQGNLVFMKTDTHWTSQGSYAAYNAIMDRLISDGVITKKVDFSPDFSQTIAVEGDLGNMIGPGALPSEDMNIAVWDQNFTKDAQSSKFAAVSDCLDLLSETTNVEIQRNEQRYVNSTENVNPLTLQIYGDSLYLSVRQINQYFAESFETVQYCRVRSVCEELDDVIDPDIVIFSAFERFAETVLKDAPLLCPDDPELADRTEIAVDSPEQWIGNKGVYISLTDKNIGTVDKLDILLDKNAEKYSFEGWAFDYNMKTDLDGLLIYLDDTPISSGYGAEGSDVGEYFGYENVKNCRFTFVLNKELLTENNGHSLKFIMLSSDGVHKYKPVVYNLKFK